MFCVECSVRKAERLLDYPPRYRSLEAIRESVCWLSANQVITNECMGEGRRL
jgi:hypothetical protein